jgi:hypothetical protein
MTSGPVKSGALNLWLLDGDVVEVEVPWGVCTNSKFALIALFNLEEVFVRTRSSDRENA